MPVTGGVAPECALTFERFDAVVPKGREKAVEIEHQLPPALCAPVAQGQEVGRVIYRLDGAEIGTTPILAAEAVGKIDFSTLFCRLLSQFLLI